MHSYKMDFLVCFVLVAAAIYNISVNNPIHLEFYILHL